MTQEKITQRYLLETMKGLADLMVWKVALLVASVAGFGAFITKEASISTSISISLMYGMIAGGGLSLDNIKDIEADKISKPWKPLPSGVLDLDEAWRFTTILFIFSLTIASILYLSNLKMTSLVLTIASLLLALFYSLPPRLSEVPLLGAAAFAFLSTTFPLLAGWTLYKPVDSTLLPIIGVLFLLAWGHIEDFVDVEGDRKIRTKTLPILLGRKKAALIFFLIVCSSLLIAVHESLINPKLYWFLSLPQLVIISSVVLFLVRVSERSKIDKLSRIYELFSLFTGITMIIGYIIFG